MGFNVTRVTTEDTQDIIKAMNNTCACLESIVYEDIDKEEYEYLEAHMQQLYYGLLQLNEILLEKLPKYNLKMPKLMPSMSERCFGCGRIADKCEMNKDIHFLRGVYGKEWCICSECLQGALNGVFDTLAKKESK